MKEFVEDENNDKIFRLANLDALEVSLVPRGANNKKFLLRKSKNGTHSMNFEKFAQDILDVQIENEEEITKSCKEAGLIDEQITMIKASLRLLSGVDQTISDDNHRQVIKNIIENKFSILKKMSPGHNLSNEESQSRLKERSSHFGSEVLKDALLTIPKGLPTNLDDYADPVNLKFPMDTLERAQKTRALFKQTADQVYKQDTSKAVIHERIVRREISLGMKPGFDSNDSLDALLPSGLKEQLKTGSFEKVGKTGARISTQITGEEVMSGETNTAAAVDETNEIKDETQTAGAVAPEVTTEGETVAATTEAEETTETTTEATVEGAIEGAAAATTAAATEGVEEVQKQLKTLWKEKEEILKAKEKLEEELHIQKEATLTKEYTEIAKEFKNLSVNAEEFGPTLKTLNQLDGEVYEKVMAVLKAADETIKQSGLFVTKGTDKAGGNSNAWNKIETMAEGLVQKSEKHITKHQAIDAVLKTEQGRKLYQEYVNEVEGVS